MTIWRVAVVVAAWLLLVSPCWATSDHEKRAQELFAQAVDAYKKGDFLQSIQLNQSIIASGLESAPIHYNLANSYLRSRQMGLAVASYLRAQKIAPRDSDIRANLTYVRSLVNEPANSKPRWVAPLQGLSTQEIRWILLFFFMISSSLILAALFFDVKGKKVMISAVFSVLVCTYLLSGLVYRIIIEKDMGVCLDPAEARFEPSLLATTYFKLPEGAEVKVLKVQDEWAKVERADHRSGWIPRTSLERI